MHAEETLILVKPDGVARGLTGEILRRIEAKGYTIADLRMTVPTRELLEAHYEEHQGKPFFEPLVEFMMSGPVVAVRASGNRVIEGFRSLAGTTDPTSSGFREAGLVNGQIGGFYNFVAFVTAFAMVPFARRFGAKPSGSSASRLRSRSSGAGLDFLPRW